MSKRQLATDIGRLVTISAKLASGGDRRIWKGASICVFTVEELELLSSILSNIIGHLIGVFPKIDE